MGWAPAGWGAPPDRWGGSGSLQLGSGPSQASPRGFWRAGLGVSHRYVIPRDVPSGPSVPRGRGFCCCCCGLINSQAVNCRRGVSRLRRAGKRPGARSRHPQFPRHGGTSLQMGVSAVPWAGSTGSPRPRGAAPLLPTPVTYPRGVSLHSPLAGDALGVRAGLRFASETPTGSRGRAGPLRASAAPPLVVPCHREPPCAGCPHRHPSQAGFPAQL